MKIKDRMTKVGKRKTETGAGERTKSERGKGTQWEVMEKGEERKGAEDNGDGWNESKMRTGKMENKES